jgi:integration host factor subunit beta
MVKSELINIIANKLHNLPLKDVELGVNQILECISNELSNGRRIEIRGFGSFRLHYHSARIAHNPKTGEKVATISKYTSHFKPGKELRERVNSQYGKTPIIGHVSEAEEDSSE